MRRVALFLALLLVGADECAHADGGPLGIDHAWALDQSGIWARHYQTALQFSVIGVEVGGALWLGNDDRLGHTFWQTIDSSVVTGIASEALKLTFSRARPDQGNDPDKWFQGHCCESFPSGEVTLQASFVTPLIVNYRKDTPWIWALEAASPVRLHRPPEVPGPLADRRAGRLGTGFSRGLLEREP